MRKLLLLSAAFLLGGGQAFAEDLQPPWWRGRLSTTSQVWEFNVPIQPGTVVPPDGPAIDGQPPLTSTHLIWTPGPPPWDHWISDDQGRLGVIPLSGSIEILVDNHDPNPDNEKWIRVQITWRPQDVGEEPIFEYLDPPPVRPPELVQEIPLGNDWRESTYDWKLDWNPPEEFILIVGTINVDELVIDTWCVPEPAAACLLALGAGVLLIRRRR
jgi:hypothetical protein